MKNDKPEVIHVNFKSKTIEARSDTVTEEQRRLRISIALKAVNDSWNEINKLHNECNHSRGVCVVLY